LFHNPHTIEAVVPAKIVVKRKHVNILKDDEITVYWPCFMSPETKVISTDLNTKQQIDGNLGIAQTAEVQQYMAVGTFLRFAHEPTNYYKVYDFKLNDGIFGGAPTLSVRLVRQDMSIQPTNKRSSFDENDIVVVTDISDAAPPPPSKQRRRWGY